MRDPELVFKAQLAASALERAWQRWRVIHGLVTDPMPTISSYVGYSLEEPWGQPRVVFGLAADDAEQLAALLDQHDCIGPVHAMVAAMPGERELPARAGGRAGLPLPVPPQAPAVAAEQSGSGDRRSGRKSANARKAGPGDHQDGPVFRQVTRAAREAAAARGGADGQVPPRTPVIAETSAEIASDRAAASDSALAPGSALASESAVDATASGADAAARDAEARDAEARDAEARDAEARDAEARDAEAREAEAREAEARGDAERRDDAGRRDDTERGGGTDVRDHAEACDAVPRDDIERDDIEEGHNDTGRRYDAEVHDHAGGGTQDLGAAEAEGRQGAAADDQASAGPAAGQAAEGPGPLALAASAAREAAEARIRAALHQTRRSGLEAPYPSASYPSESYPSESFDVTEPTRPQPAAAGPAGAADAQAGAVQAPSLRPEVASGAQPRPSRDVPDVPVPAEQSGVASSWGGPEFGASDAGQPPVVPFLPRPDLAAYLDAGPEADPAFDERQDHTSASYARRNRITRGYSIPRLSRSKRPGAVPGA